MGADCGKSHGKDSVFVGTENKNKNRHFKNNSCSCLNYLSGELCLCQVLESLFRMSNIRLVPPKPVKLLLCISLTQSAESVFS